MTTLNPQNLHALLTMDIQDEKLIESKMDNLNNDKGISHDKSCHSELTANTSVQTTLSKKRNG